jgi:hypothetical protein
MTDEGSNSSKKTFTNKHGKGLANNVVVANKAGI